MSNKELWKTNQEPLLNRTVVDFGSSKWDRYCVPQNIFLVVGRFSGRHEYRWDNESLWDVFWSGPSANDCYVCSASYWRWGFYIHFSVMCRQERSAKLTNQRVSYAFTSSPFSFHACHILPTSKFQYSYSCILLIFYRHQWTACMRTVSVNTVHWFDASSSGNPNE